MTRWVPMLMVVVGCNPVLSPVVEQQAQAVTAVTKPPRVVWVLDSSGSLMTPVDPTAPACPAGCGTSSPCPAQCETRLSLLRAGLQSLATTLPPARNGAVIYPSDATCGPPTTWVAPVPPTASTESLQLISTRYQATTPLGGTPTAAALDFVARTLPDEPDTETFVVLVTDGLPNCNAANPNNQCAGPNPACRCAISACTGSLCALGCLDDLGTIDSSRALARTHASLLVVGLGPEVIGSGSQVLSSLEISLPRVCATNADCRVGTRCAPTGVCEERFYAVESLADFSRPSKRIFDAVDRSTRCTFWLEHEVVPTELTVLVADAPLAATSWALEGGRRVRLSPAACEGLGAAQPAFHWRPGTAGKE